MEFKPVRKEEESKLAFIVPRIEAVQPLSLVFDSMRVNSQQHSDFHPSVRGAHQELRLRHNFEVNVLDNHNHDMNHVARAFLTLIS